MPGRRPFLLLAMLAALVVAPSTVSAAKPAPKMVTVDASPQPGSSDSPTNAAASPTNPPPASAAPAPQATATPHPSVAPAPQQQATARLASSESRAVRNGDGPGNRDRPRPRPGRTSSAAPSRTPDEAPGGGPATRTPSTDEANPSTLWLLLVWGTGAVGAVALIGTTWLLVAGRREQAPADALDGAEPDIAVRAIPSVEQRALRRARLRQEDDPILAGLGLEEEARRAPSPRSRRGARPRH
ncbi:MAG TPA: hypothetical protein VFH98_08920 [Candidatus Limnocylindria bacterium]|nr:hypothetical protein [Candidatus Limnocylindria bacterium]